MSRTATWLRNRDGIGAIGVMVHTQCVKHEGLGSELAGTRGVAALAA
jgi:hypothetical protein